jgi:hypothetical protein
MIRSTWDFGPATTEPLRNLDDVIQGMMGSADTIDFARFSEWGESRFFCVVGQINIK